MHKNKDSKNKFLKAVKEKRTKNMKWHLTKINDDHLQMLKYHTKCEKCEDNLFCTFKLNGILSKKCKITHTGWTTGKTAVLRPTVYIRDFLIITALKY